MPPRDEFDDPEGFFSRLITLSGRGSGSIFENRSLVISGLVFISVVALSGVIWASYPAQNPLASEGGVPIIRADAQAYKYVPADRGGMAIAHRDSTIFNAMRDGQGDGKLENLLDNTPDEVPLDRQELFAGLKTDLANVANDGAVAGDGHVEVARMGDYVQDRPLSESERRAEAARRNRELLEEEAEPLPGDLKDNTRRLPPVLKAQEVEPDLTKKPVKQAPSELPPEDAALEKAEAEAATKAAAARAAEEKAAVTKKNAEPKKTMAKTEPKAEPKKTAETAKAQPGAGTSYVQVASVPDQGRVASEWAAVSGKLPMIAGMSYRTQRADLGAKGVYHRIQVGPMSKDAAVDLCAKIKAQKPGGCLVVK